MPADERATLTPKQQAEELLKALAHHVGDRGWDRFRMWAIIERGLIAADRLAREDAARIADCHTGYRATDGSLAPIIATVMNDCGERIAAAIRASITTDEG